MRNTRYCNDCNQHDGNECTQDGQTQNDRYTRGFLWSGLFCDCKHSTGNPSHHEVQILQLVQLHKLLRGCSRLQNGDGPLHGIDDRFENERLVAAENRKVLNAAGNDSGGQNAGGQDLEEVENAFGIGPVIQQNLLAEDVTGLSMD